MSSEFKWIEKPYHYKANRSLTKLKWLNALKGIQRYFQTNDIKKTRYGWLVNQSILISPNKRWKYVGTDEWFTYYTVRTLALELLKDTSKDAPKDD